MNKSRPNTWNCQLALLDDNRVSLESTYTQLKSNMRCHSQDYNNSTMGSSITEYDGHDDAISLHRQILRQTMQTISTLSTYDSYTDRNSIKDPIHCLINNSTITSNTTVYNIQNEVQIFHTQSMLFLFGFLFFPCWWIGGYYLKLDESLLIKDDIETKTLTVHPSLLANGKTCSKLLYQQSRQLPLLDSNQVDYYLLDFFYKWNRIMTLFSIFLILFILFLLIWYFITK